jgi:hypothetical protein
MITYQLVYLIFLGFTHEAFNNYVGLQQHNQRLDREQRAREAGQIEEGGMRDDNLEGNIFLLKITYVCHWKTKVNVKVQMQPFPLIFQSGQWRVICDF